MKRILVVDDEANIANVIAESLTMDGHDAMTAYSGMKALSIIQEVTPDILFLDLMMPQMSGQQVFETLVLQGKRERMCVILMSAHPRLPEEASRLQAIGYMRKAFKLDDVDALVEHRCT